MRQMCKPIGVVLPGHVRGRATLSTMAGQRRSAILVATHDGLLSGKMAVWP
jgi:hypothetical protein